MIVKNIQNQKWKFEKLKKQTKLFKNWQKTARKVETVAITVKKLKKN